MAADRLRVGIVGASINAAWGPRTHVPAVQALPEYELVAVCTSHEESARASAEKFGVRLAFHDHQEMVNHPDVDVVTVSLRVPNHLQVTMDALAAGKHVYTEWPLGATLQEAQDMADLGRSKGVKTMVGLQARGSPTWLRIKELLDEGYVGDVLSCHLTHFSGAATQRTSDRTWQRDRSAGANPMTIAFGHAIDIFCHTLGEFQEISAVVSTQIDEWYETDTQRAVEVTAPDNILVSGTLKNGAVASVHVGSQPYHGSGYKLEVYGREGTLVVNTQAGAQTGQLRLVGGKAEDKELQELPVPDRLTWVPADTPEGTPFNVAQMYRRFADSIHTGERVEPDFDTGVERHKLLDAIDKASAEGQRQVLA